jgi:hypothetical protein
MPSQLCHVCRRIPPEFFSKKFGDIWSFQGPAICLQPVNSIHRAASSGCSLCAVLIARSKTDFLPPDVLERVPVSLRRAVLDTHQAIGLWIGIDDISHTSFFRVPPSWSKQKAPSVWLQDRIDESIDNFGIIEHWIRDCVRNHKKRRMSRQNLWIDSICII